MAQHELELWHHDDPLDEWDRFVDLSPQGCVFCRSWWLRAVCPDSFDILVLRESGRIVAGMPLPYRRRRGARAIIMPPLTQTLGVLLAPQERADYQRALSQEMAWMGALVEGIPPCASLVTRLHPSLGNWLPFYWAGYQQTTRYTYILDGLGDLERVSSELAHSKRKNIKRAQGLVAVQQDLDPGAFYDNHALTLRKQGDRINYPRELFLRLHEACYAHAAGKTWYAVDEAGHLHAAIFVAYDAHTAYYLLSSIDPDHRNSGAATLLVWEAIQHVAPLTQRFDFEGSMVQGVEQSFRRFGARQAPFFQIERVNCLPELILRDARGWWRWLRQHRGARAR